MNERKNNRLLFIINPVSGSNTTDWAKVISDYFSELTHRVEFYHLTHNCNIQTIIEKIKLFSPEQVIAVGGDGTVSLVAETLIGKDILMGILPAGSANGLAKELGIGNNPMQTLDMLVKGYSKKIHLLRINDQLCIHLSDIGLNAYAMKVFETQPGRGMWGYFRASLKVLWQNPTMEVVIEIDDKITKMKAEMIVIANATKYGSGALINPIGTLEDELFEVIVVKKVSVQEIFKMIFSHKLYDSDKTEIFQTGRLKMRSAKKVHFQVDGEYLGKVNEINATIIPYALNMIVPEPEDLNV